MKKNRTSKIVLIVIAIVLTMFTIANLLIFVRIGAVPDVLITSVFAACLGELGFLSWIRNTKQKYSDDEQYDDFIDEEEE